MNQFDPMIIEKILHQLKSQGIFDQFRKECMSDVDTKPAYQNLRQRVDGSVTGFLSTHTWRPDLNKNQLRDSLRKHIQNSGFLDMGVERIVDQVVNPKICPLFHPQVEEVVYDCLGVNKPGGPERLINNTTTKTVENSFRPRFSSEINKERKQKVVDDASITKIKPHTINETSLLPHDLEPISPASEDRLVDTNEIEDFGDDEEISPPFEPHVDGNSDDSHLSESLQSNTFTIYRSKPETVNTDVHDYKNIENEDKTEKVELKTVDSVQRELVSDDDISVKENKGSNKGKTTKMYTILKNKSASDDICKKIFLKSDYFITCSDEERTANKVSKIKNYSQISDSEITNGGTTNETDLNSQLCKKPNTDLKIKISNSGSYHHKKSQSGSSKYSEKDYHNHHKHADRKSNSHSRCHSGKTNNKLKYSKISKQSEIKNVDKKEKYYKKHENIDTKHNTKVKSKDEKIKHVKTGHKNQIKDCVENINGIYLTKDHKDKQKEISDKHFEFKDHIESNREDTHIESKQDKHRCSGKSYSRFRKEDHSWNGNDKHIINEQLGITITVIKDDKKSTVRDKRRELSKIKHSKKHCKSNEKFKEGRRSSDRDSNGQGEGSNTTDNVSSHSQSQSQTSPEKDNISQSSNDTFVCDSVEYVEPVYSSYGSEYSITASKQDHKEESDKGDHKILALKSNIKKKHSNVYEVRKRIQARKSLERIRNKRTQAEIEKTVNNNTNFNKDRFDVKRPRLTEQNPAKDSGSILNRNNNNFENIEVITIIENEYTNKNFNDEDVDNFKRSENSIAMNSISNKLQPNLKNTSSLKIKKHKKDPSIFEGKKSVNDLNRLVVISLDSNAENEYTNKNFNGDNVVLKPSECIVTINKLEPNFRNISSLTIKKHKKDSSIFRRNNSTNDLNRQENKNGTEIESKVKTHSKMESFDKEKMNEVSINQENEPDIMINNENFKNQDFALVKLNSANNISILPMTSDLKSNVPVIQSLIDMKKSHRKKPKVKSRRSEEYAKKKESSKKRCCSTRDSEAVTNSGQEHSTVHSKMIIGSNVDNCRQNKILKVINQDVRGEARFEEFTNPEKEPRYSIEVLEGDIFTQGYNTSQTDNEEYSDNKPIKLATKLMDVALQDLLMESGLSSACSTEEQERINKNSQHGCNSSGKKLKVSSEKPPTSHQQHYDKSDLYKPRPRFTQSSKRTRRCEVEPTSGDSSVQLPKLSYPISKR